MFVAKPLHSAFWLISACRTLPLFQMLLLSSASYRRCCPFFLRLAFIGPPLLRPTLPFQMPLLSYYYRRFAEDVALCFRCKVVAALLSPRLGLPDTQQPQRKLLQLATNSASSRNKRAPTTQPARLSPKASSAVASCGYREQSAAVTSCNCLLRALRTVMKLLTPNQPETLPLARTLRTASLLFAT